MAVIMLGPPILQVIRPGRPLEPLWLPRPACSTPTCCAGTCGQRRSASVVPPPGRRQSDTGRCGVPEGPAQPNFTWAEHGEALMHRRKSGYYEREPIPGISVIGARLSELVRR